MKKRAWLFIAIYFLAILLFPLGAFAQTSPPNQQSMDVSLSLTPPDTDLSVSYLSNIFGTVEGVLSGTGSQLLGALFGVFNGAVLVLGGIVIFYTLFVSTLNTAHEGEVLGKNWSSVWIPLRSVAGVALLIPKASGYSFVQTFMLWVVVMGVGAADSVWSAALNYFLSGGVLIQQNTALSNISGGTTLLTSSGKLLQSLTCTVMLQKELENLRNTQLSSNPPSPNPIPPVPNFYSDIQASINSQLSQDTATVYFPTSKYLGTDGVCGYAAWQASVAAAGMGSLPPQTAKQMQQSRGLAVQTMITQLYGAAEQIASNALVADPKNNQYELGHILNPSPAGSPPPSVYIWGAGSLSQPKRPLLPGNLLSNAASGYFGMMAPTLNFISQLSGNSQALQALKTWTDSAKQAGWIEAGKYYQSLIAVNKQMVLTDPAPPTFANNEFATLLQKISGIFPTGSSSAQDVYNLVTGSGLTQLGTSSKFMTDQITYGTSLTYGDISYSPPSGGPSASDQIGSMVSVVTGAIGPVLDQFSSLATAQASGQNPVMLLISLGALLINITCGVFIGLAVLILALTLALGLAWGFTFSVAMVATIMPILALFTPVLLALLVAGLIMALYLPLIPFIIFTFGAIGWFIAVIEAVLAAPLVALGIAHPEGQPILGKAEPAVGLLVNVFLRPTFMIFGLLLGMMLSYVSLWLLNQGFWGSYAVIQGTAIASQGNPIGAGFVGMFAGLAATVIYALLVMQIVQKSFTLIYIIPDEVLKWIGINIKGMGGEAEAEKAISTGAQTAAQTGGEMVSKGPATAQETSAAIGKAETTEKGEGALQRAFKGSSGFEDDGGGSPPAPASGGGVKQPSGGGGGGKVTGGTGGSGGTKMG